MIFSMHEKLSPNEPRTREPFRVDGIAVLPILMSVIR